MKVKEQELWDRVFRAHRKLERARDAFRASGTGWDEMRAVETRVWKAERAFRKAEAAWKAEAEAAPSTVSTMR